MDGTIPRTALTYPVRLSAREATLESYDTCSSEMGCWSLLSRSDSTPCLRYDMTFSKVYILLRYGIAQFVGSWVSESGYRLHIRKVRKDQAFVDFLDPRGAPIVRPYMVGAPSIKMIAHYADYNEDFRVGLWEEGKGFILHLDHEYDYVLDSEQREALEPAISRYERDRFLDAYYSLFGPLDHFVRTTARNKRL